MSKRRLFQSEVPSKRLRRSYNYWRFGPPFPEAVDRERVDEQQEPLALPSSPVTSSAPLSLDCQPTPRPHDQDNTIKEFAQTAEAFTFSDDDLGIAEPTTSKANNAEDNPSHDNNAPTFDQLPSPVRPPRAPSRRASTGLGHKDMHILLKLVPYTALPPDAVVAQPPDGICPCILFPPPNATDVRCPFCDVSWSRQSTPQQVRIAWASHIRRKHRLHVPDGFWRINELAAGALRRTQQPVLASNQTLKPPSPSVDPIEGRSHVTQHLNGGQRQNLTLQHNIGLTSFLPLPLESQPEPLDIQQQTSMVFAPSNSGSQQLEAMSLASNHPSPLLDQSPLFSSPSVEQDGTEPLGVLTTRSRMPLSYESGGILVKLDRPPRSSASEVSRSLAPPKFIRSPSRAPTPLCIQHNPPISPPSSQHTPHTSPHPLLLQTQPLPLSSSPFPSQLSKGILDAVVSDPERPVPSPQLPLPSTVDVHDIPSTHTAYPVERNNNEHEASKDGWVVVEKAPSDGDASMSDESREEILLDFDQFEYSESDESSFEDMGSLGRGGRRSFRAAGLRSSSSALQTRRRTRSNGFEGTDSHEVRDSSMPGTGTSGLGESSHNNDPAIPSAPHYHRAYQEQLEELRALVQQATLLARQTEALERMVGPGD